MEHFLSEFARRFPSGDFFVSLPFWGVFAAVVLLYRAAPARPALKELLLLGCSISMLLLLPRFTVPVLIVFLGLCAWTYAAGSSLSRSGWLTTPGSRRLVAATGVLGVVLALAFFKYRFLQEAILRPRAGSGIRGTDFILLIGISYSSFKAMHFILEGYKRELKLEGFLPFLNYMLFFPSFISGPINRYPHYRENSAVARKSRLRDDLGPGLERIIHGLFKKTVLTMVLFPYTLTHMGIPVEQMPVWMILLGLYAYSLYFYFDFSGYTDLAIGTARLMGFVLPENFNDPLLKRNIQQLWANWHMSLTGWLTDYVYWPLVRRMRNSEMLRKHPLVVSNLAIIVAFLLCGIWHGEGLHFILWGLFHGLGIAVVNVYQSWKRKVRHPTALHYFRSPFSQWLGIIATFNFFSLAQLFFVLDSKQVHGILTRWF